jgi:hypothetical protein
MIILTDCDGVLLSWEHSFNWWMKRKGYKSTEHTKTAYNVDKKYNISKEEADALVRHFNESAAVGFLPPLGDAIKYVRKFHEEHGAVFHCITSMGLEPYANKLREENLYNVFGRTAFERVQCIDCGEPKIEPLKRYKDSGFPWIEDKPANADIGIEMGLQSFLINRPYNVDAKVHPDVIRVNNWKEIYEHIAS